MTGTIFDIKEFSIHDGPGSRITVFLKGCPLRCLWCHNPEGLSQKPQLMIKNNLCSHCGKCVSPCSHPECASFDRCVHSCPNGCISVAGEEISTDVLAERLLKNRDFFDMTNGGITISGGEPMLQYKFVLELAGKLKGIHLALQTSGYADHNIYKSVINKFDFVMQDIKLANDEEHIKYTGVSNKQILENIEYLKQSGKEFVLRVPLIPDITDTEENLCLISEIAGDFPVELLSYNPMAGAKYEMLGYNYTLNDNKKNTEVGYTRYFKNATLR